MNPAFPVLDDHMHLSKRTGTGPAAIRDFLRSGGTHVILVSLPSWSSGVVPSAPEDFRVVFDELMQTADEVRNCDCICYTMCGVHPAEIGRLAERLGLEKAEELMKGALDVAAGYVLEGNAIGLKSGRPHYPVSPEIWEASDRILLHALQLAGELSCPLQIHAESGPCSDIPDMARKAGMDPARVIKHFATTETPLHPSVTVREPFLLQWFQEKREFTLESDYMDDKTRPGAVNGPRSVPRKMRHLIQEGILEPEDMWRVHSEVPEKIYGAEFSV
jgi:TatD-related deoxyribonuclease